MSSANLARLAATAAGSSPTCAPKFMLLKRPVDVPPEQVVIVARTWVGAGHCGTNQSLGQACAAE
jgi:hypothetical protein